jgi:RNA polymerase sigma factor (TIGR02999 family)
MSPPLEDVTVLLADLRKGDSGTVRRLLPLVYGELRRLAEKYLRGERAGHTLQPTALVHEAYIRLVEQTGATFNDRAHFFAVAARAMRHIIVDHARGKRAARRGGGHRRQPLERALALSEQPDAYLLALDESLQRLAQIDPQAARIVELRFFGGMTVDEIAEVLEISARTVKRDWGMAKGWLHREITG